jgi:raffinose/stachyose/melibiose transport system substrate-binding protein
MMRYPRALAPLLVLGLLLAACQTEVDEDPADLTQEDDGNGNGVEDEDVAEADGDAVTLVIESWRSDDVSQWEQEIIPAFEDQHPNIQLEFSPTAPTEYDGALQSRMEGGTAGDIITCRSFDRARQLHANGFLEEIDDIDGLENFDEFALHAWQTSEGDATFCVPAASVIHGFYYNVEAFDELGLDVPDLNDEFLAALEQLDADGTYDPLAWGTADEWIATSTAFDLIGPNFWNGEEGRQALLAGEKLYTDDDFVQAWSFIDDWQAYFPGGYESVTYEDTQQLFALGQAAIMPAGSWEISLWEEIADIEVGAFRPTRPEGQDGCYINDHPDMGFGMNANTDHPDEVRTFLEWVATEEFAEIYANGVPGFFPLSEFDVSIDNELAQEFVSWRDECESTARLNFEDLTAGDPSIEAEAGRLTVQMWNEDLAPEEVAQQVQTALESWYEPHQ